MECSRNADSNEKAYNLLSVVKMLSGANACEISDIQETEITSLDE